MFAPAKTPAALITRLNQEVVRALNIADTKQKLFNAGIEVVGSSPEQFTAAIKADMTGMGKVLKDVDMDNDSFKGIEAIILSMTPYEREHPDCINGSRRKRIADGSGTSLPEVNKLLKQFEGTRKMMKTVMGANMGNMMKGAMKAGKRRR
jgi:signal recognition particle GTPase